MISREWALKQLFLSRSHLYRCIKRNKKGNMRPCSCGRPYFPFNIAIERWERTVPGRDNSGAPTASFGRWKWRGRGRRGRCPFAPIKSNYSNSRKGNVHLIIVWPKHVLMTDIAVSAYAFMRRRKRNKWLKAKTHVSFFFFCDRRKLNANCCQIEQHK